jgi:HK97 family phage portal protein
MAVIQSLGALADLQPLWNVSSYSYGAVKLYDALYYDYATLYRTQPNIRTCVDFLARNIAQLGLHVYRRVSDTDRQRLVDHELAQVIAKPNPWTTRYRLIESLMSDLGIYLNAYWLKIRPTERLYLLRVPPQLVTPEGGLFPRRYTIDLGGKVIKATPDQLVHFRGYNPEDATQGLSPMETLRRVLAEEHAMGDYREYFWRNAARMNGVIQRPREAPEWSKDARERFKQEFEALYSGGANSGKTAILEEGMEWKETSFNAQESEYLGGRKLTREECARAYHIPLPMVGILDHATFSNIKEQHKQLYQDALGPWLVMIVEDIELQLLPDMADIDRVYLEFNIEEKLRGSFEEQTTALQAAVGRPWLTADEARGRMNLPSMGGDAARLVTPLNVLVGGQASPRDSAPGEASHRPTEFKALKSAAELDPTLQQARGRHMAKWAQVISKYFERQRNAIIGRVREGAGIETIWIDGERWDSELAADLFRLNAATAKVWAKWVADQLEAEFDADRMANYLQAVSENSAQRINASTRDQIMDALMAETPRDAVRHLFEIAQDSRAKEISTTGVTNAANFGSQEGARQGGLKTKTWVVNSANPRDEHAAMAGETVGIDDLFSNGMRWPGDPAGGAENNANCECSVAFGRD